MKIVNNKSMVKKLYISLMLFLYLFSFFSSAEQEIHADKDVVSIESVRSLAEQIENGHWSDGIKESDSSYECPYGEIMVGRSHYGDENEDTYYQCATVKFDGQPVYLGHNSWSNEIKESSGIYFTCPVNQLMIGRKHNGDENGYTRYKCAEVSINNYDLAIKPRAWSSSLKESNHEYICPPGSLMMGRFHDGDENGDTKYLCGSIQWGTSPVVHYESEIIPPLDKCPYGMAMTGASPFYTECSGLDINGSPAKATNRKETSGQCPENYVMTGRIGSVHECSRPVWKGSFIKQIGSPDFVYGFSCPTGEYMTGIVSGRLTCAKFGVLNHQGTLEHVYNRIINHVGYPATTYEGSFATQAVMGIDDTYFLQLDIGGEGYANIGFKSGFEQVINVNAQEYHSQTGRPIPSLVYLNDWATEPPYPFADGTVDYLTMQGAPLTSQGVEEFARVLKRGKGTVGLWVNTDQPMMDHINRLANLLNSSVDMHCDDEFDGEYPFPKICIDDRR